MRLLHLEWPHLPFRIEAARTPLPELVVVGGRPWDQGDVLDYSPAAGRLGVRAGQLLGSAHRLVPEACFLPADRAAYAAAMERALEVLARFTPSLEAESDPAADGFGRVLLGIEGLERLWGDEATLAGRVLAAVGPLLPGSPRVGIGNTRFGARVAAAMGSRRAGDGPARPRVEPAPPLEPAARVETVAQVEETLRVEPAPRVEIIPAGDAIVEAAYLAPLPISLLPPDDRLRERLRLLGLNRLGDFAALPRSAVVARFGPKGAMLHDLARGLDGRPLRPRRPLEQLRAEAEIEPPAETIEPLRFVLRHLCAALCEQLAARGAGCGQAVLELELDHAPAVRLAQPLPEPVAVPELIERLLLARLTADLPPAAVTRLSLELQGSTPAAAQQLGLFSPQLARAGRLDWQLVGLAIRFGADRLLRARILDPEAILPEERSQWQRVTGAPLAATADGSPNQAGGEA